MRTLMAASIAATIVAGSMAGSAVMMEPAAEPEHGSRRNRPSNNAVVPGGGMRERERERRKRKALKALMLAEGRDHLDDEDQF